MKESNAELLGKLLAAVRAEDAFKPNPATRLLLEAALASAQGKATLVLERYHESRDSNFRDPSTGAPFPVEDNTLTLTTTLTWRYKRGTPGPSLDL